MKRIVYSKSNIFTLLIFGYQQAIRKHLNTENFPIYGGIFRSVLIFSRCARPCYAKVKLLYDRCMDMRKNASGEGGEEFSVVHVCRGDVCDDRGDDV